MFIKIEMPEEGKISTHEAESYFVNELQGNAMDFNVKVHNGELRQYHFPDKTVINIYVMNDKGDTIDRY